MNTPLFDLENIADPAEEQARLVANKLIWELERPENRVLLERVLSYHEFDSKLFNIRNFVDHMTWDWHRQGELALAWVQFYFKVMAPLSRNPHFDQMALAYAYFRLMGIVDIFNVINEPREA